MMRRAWVRLAILTLALGGLVASGCSRTVIPSEYTTFNAEDQSFKCDAPAGWEVTGGGKNGNYNATFSSGGTEISVTVDVVGSVLGDIAKAGNPAAGTDPNADPELSPLYQAHQRNGEIMAEGLGDFQDLTTVELHIPIGIGKKSEYTGKGSLGSAQHGYRVTSLLTSQQLRICCQCPESEWKALQPVFDRVINSVADGR